ATAEAPHPDVGGPAEFADSIQAYNRAIRYSATDFTIATSAGPIAFTRYYALGEPGRSEPHFPDTQSPAYPTYPAPPFDSASDGGIPASPHWSHTFYSFVTTRNNYGDTGIGPPGPPDLFPYASVRHPTGDENIYGLNDDGGTQWPWLSDMNSPTNVRFTR